MARKFRKTGRKIPGGSAANRAIHALVDFGSPGKRAKRSKSGNLNVSTARVANKKALRDPRMKSIRNVGKINRRGGVKMTSKEIPSKSGKSTRTIKVL